jgi:hypothetical protein
MQTGGSVPIWFFIGISLVVNGLLILGAGIVEFFHPPETKLILFELHAGIWWGAILAAVGAFFCVYHVPGKNRT